MNKYRNTWTRCNQGHNHQSKFEANYCNNLDLLKKAGEILDYEIQRTFILSVNGKLICTHRIDFFVTTKENKKEIHEVKGYKTKDWKIKKTLTEALYPDIKYIVIGGK